MDVLVVTILTGCVSLAKGGLLVTTALAFTGVCARCDPLVMAEFVLG